MCGRFVRTTPVKVLASLFDCPLPVFDLPPNYNTAPTQTVAVVRLDERGQRELAALRWGVLPRWAPDTRTALVNARADTVATKPSFRSAFKKRRCLMPADGYYEWHKEGRVKQPYYFRQPDEKPFVFAALWETWAKGTEPIHSCALITTARDVDPGFGNPLVTMLKLSQRSAPDAACKGRSVAIEWSDPVPRGHDGRVGQEGQRHGIVVSCRAEA